MQASIEYFQQRFNKKKVSMKSKYLNVIFHGFTCYLIIQENLKAQEIDETKKLKNESKIIVIDIISHTDGQQLVFIIFDQTILFIQKKNI